MTARLSQIMRIDGRFDPKQWIKPQTEEVIISTKVEEQQDGNQIAFSAAEETATHEEFAGEMEKNYAYTHASRTAATVTRTLDETPDL
jgi:hypothetical protein